MKTSTLILDKLKNEDKTFPLLDLSQALVDKLPVLAVYTIP